MYLDSNISSTESDVNIRRGKAQTAIDRLSTILSLWSNKTVILPSRNSVSTTVWLHLRDSRETPSKIAEQELHENAAGYSEQVLEAAPYKTAVYFSSHRLF